MGRSTVIFMLLLAAGLSAAPHNATRVLRSFDFEERKRGNVEDLPMNWVKVEGQGYPHYVNGRLSNDRAHSGAYSFRFDLDGGGLVYRYPAGLIAVQLGGRYRIDGFVQTTVLPNARARISAYLTDIDGRPLSATLAHSDAYAAASADEGWKPLGLEMLVKDPKAAFLVLELELLQPSQYSATALGSRALFAQDIHGSAWFDDVTVSQAPRLSVTTDAPGNVFRRGDALTLHVAVGDLFTSDLSAQVVVRDADGNAVYQRSGGMDMAAVRQLPGHQQSIPLALPDLPPGWYEVTVAMTSGGKEVGNKAMSLIRLPDNAAGFTPDPRFGVIATDLPFDGWSDLADLLPMLSAGRVKLALWSRLGDIQQYDGDSFDRLLTRLGELGIAPTACLVDLPPRISSRMQNGSWPALLKSDPALWQPDLSYLIARHASHLERWQLGADGSDAFVSTPQMRKAYGLVYQQFAELVHDPDLAMPWPAWYELEGELPATVALAVPTSVLPTQIPLYMQDISRHKGHNLSLSFELLDREKYGRLAQIRDVSQRVIYALSAGATRIDLPLPFTVRRDGDQIAKDPSELLMVMRTLASTLSGATYMGTVPISEGVEAFLFDRGGQGILALWSKGSEASDLPLSIDLGQNAAKVDLWGNVSPLPHGTGKGVNITLSAMPIFLVGINAPQAELRGSVSIDQPLLESSFEPHVRRLRFTNPYKTHLSGTVKLKAPAGWTLNPPTFVFSLDPGQSFDHELTIAFPYSSVAGPRTLNCEFLLQDSRSADFSAPLTLKLGLSNLGMQTFALRDGDDILVQQLVSNYGEQPIDYTAYALCPGQPRQERLITSLGAGHSVIKRYRFKNVPKLPGGKVRVGVKELQGVRVLNEEVEVR